MKIGSGGTSVETKQQLEEQLAVIEKWEKDQKGLWFWERIGRLPFKLLDKVTPAFLQKKIGDLLDEVGNFVQSGGQYLVQEKATLSKFNGKSENVIETIDDVRNLPIRTMNEVGEELRTNRSRIAGIQGATTGFGGIFTLAVDIPVLLGISLKTLQEIAISYGYNPNEKEERIFIIKCLQFASSDYIGKQAILDELTVYGEPLNNRQMISQLQGWREVIYTYRDQFGWKKLFQMIPIAGMIFGSLTNKAMMQDVAEAGIMLYQKRRILERLHDGQVSVFDDSEV